MRPGRIWLLYSACVIGVVVAMAWLTATSLQSELAELTARHQAELEQRIGRALWRMDSRLTPVLAEEAVRPSAVYRPFLTANPSPGKATPENAASQVRLSPLLTEPTEFVLLNFELSPDQSLTSPQFVPPNQWASACSAGASEQRLRESQARFETLRDKLHSQYSLLLSTCPSRELPRESFEQQQASPIVASNAPPVSQEFVQNFDETLASQSANTNPRAQNNFNPKAQNNDLTSRSQTLQNFAQRGMRGQYGTAEQPPPPSPAITVREGVSRPIWLEGELLLARRATLGTKTVIQGSWLDWPRIRATLLDEVSDLLPTARLEPVLDAATANPGRILATIPAQLLVTETAVTPERWSPIRVSLWTAWGAMLLTALAIAALLQGVLTLSERRASFVSAVTHELRTPLTTFRMYAEMLAEDMVPDAARRREYLETLRGEADRLSHLVENVLQYARLERGRPGQRREAIRVDELLHRQASRLSDRARQAGMQLVVEFAAETEAATVNTDPAAVEQILLNLVDNACKYAASAEDKRIHLSTRRDANEILFAVRDHGAGISAAGAKRLFQPFSKSVHEAAVTAPGVGLGLALSHRLAQELGGSLRLVGNQGGATFELSLPRSG